MGHPPFNVPIYEKKLDFIYGTVNQSYEKEMTNNQTAIHFVATNYAICLLVFWNG